jgi:hypothetical protein
VLVVVAGVVEEGCDVGAVVVVGSAVVVSGVVERLPGTVVTEPSVSAQPETRESTRKRAQVAVTRFLAGSMSRLSLPTIDCTETRWVTGQGIRRRAERVRTPKPWNE